MKNFLRLALILVAAFTMQINTSQAQVSLTQAVDFTVTDVEGVTWNLFDILDNQEKYVVIDFWYST